MRKKILSIVVCFSLLWGIQVAAINPDGSIVETPPPVSEEMPLPGGARGGRGDMGMPPRGDMQNGDMPTRPEGGMMSPQFNGEFAGEAGLPMDMQSSENADEAKSQSDIWTFIKQYETPIFSVILLLFAFVFVALYKRKRY